MHNTETMRADVSTAGVALGLSALRIGEMATTIGMAGVRYSVTLVIAWIGAMKFTTYEAQGIEGLVANSPLMSWVYSVASVRDFSAALGIIELAIAAMIVVRVFSPRVAAVGAALAVGMFATTLSFMITTPGVYEASLGGFPALTIVPGQFLVKDFVLLAASVLLLGDALKDLSSTTK